MKEYMLRIIENIYITYSDKPGEIPTFPYISLHFPTCGQVAVQNVLLLDWHSWTQDSRGAEGQRSRRGEQPRGSDQAQELGLKWT